MLWSIHKEHAPVTMKNEVQQRLTSILGITTKLNKLVNLSFKYITGSISLMRLQGGPMNNLA